MIGRYKKLDLPNTMRFLRDDLWMKCRLGAGVVVVNRSSMGERHENDSKMPVQYLILRG